MVVRHVEGVGGPAGQRYLVDLKPIIASAADVRGDWMIMLGRLKQAEDPNLLQQEAVQIGIDRSQRFRDLRRRLTTLHAPPELSTLHRSIDGWLSAMGGSCDAIVQHSGPIGPDLLEQVRERLRVAARQAERFNAERAALAGMPTDDGSATGQGSRKKIAAAALCTLGVLIGVGYFVVGGRGSSAAAATASGLGTPGAGIERRVYPQPEILARLRQEVTGRSVQFRDVDVRLEPPDRIVIPGQVLGPGGRLIGITVELQVGAEGGRPKVTPLRVSASGVSVPQAVTDALAKRTDEANRDLSAQVPPGQLLRRVFVENNAIVAELEGAAPVGTGTPPRQP